MSPQPQFILLPCTPTHIPQIVSIHHSAFQADYLTSHTFPSTSVTPEEYRRAITTRFKRSFSKAEVHHFGIFDTLADNKVAAFARWAYPHVLSAEEKEKREEEAKKDREERERTGNDPNWPVGSNLEVVDLKFGGLDRIKSVNVDEKEMYYCQLLSVGPAYQRKGLGGLLLKHVLDIADQEGRVCYIEATDAGFPLYKRMGFEEFDEVRIDLKKWGGEKDGVNRCMKRQPKKKE